MTVDIEKLEALAKAAKGDCVKWYALEQLKSRAVDESAAELMAAANPAAVLELTQTIRDLQSSVQGLKTGYEAYERVNAELKAECEKLRSKLENPDPILIQCMDSAIAEQEQLENDARRYRWLRDGAGYCDTRDIPGMAPARMDAFIDAAMSKEQSHD